MDAPGGRFVVVALFGALSVTAALMAPGAADAAGPRGGGFQLPAGGGFGGFKRPSGGFQRPSGFQRQSGFQRPAGAQGQQPGAGNGQRFSGQGNRPTNANTGVANSGNKTRRTANNGNATRANTNTGTVGSGNGNTAYTNNGNTGVVGSGNVNTGTVGTAVNAGNVAVGNDVDVNVSGSGYGYPYGSGAAYATGVAVGVTTSAVAYGSTYSSIPASSCSATVYGGVSYYHCGSTWYRQTYQGGNATYVVVADPR